MSQQINPIRAARSDIERIRVEKTIACSLRIKKGARRRIRAASLLPIPEMDKRDKPGNRDALKAILEGLRVLFGILLKK